MRVLRRKAPITPFILPTLMSKGIVGHAPAMNKDNCSVFFRRVFLERPVPRIADRSRWSGKRSVGAMVWRGYSFWQGFAALIHLLDLLQI